MPKISGWKAAGNLLNEMKRDAVNSKGDQQPNPPQWQDVDQLCGVLEFATPKKKTITTADGKTETRMYANVLKEAKVALYRGTASDEGCCGGKTLAGNTKSDKLGRFELSGLRAVGIGCTSRATIPARRYRCT